MTQDPPSQRPDGFRNRARPSVKGTKRSGSPEDKEPTRPFKRPPPGPPRSESRTVLYLSIALAISIGLNIWQAGHWKGHSSATEHASQTTSASAAASPSAMRDTGEEGADTGEAETAINIPPRRASRDKGTSARYWLYFEKLEEAEKTSGGPPSDGDEGGPPSAELIAGDIVERAAAGDFEGLDNYISLHAVRIDAYDKAEPNLDCPTLCHDHHRMLVLELQLGQRVLNELKKVRDGESQSTELAEAVVSELLQTHRTVQTFYTQLETEKEQGNSL